MNDLERLTAFLFYLKRDWLPAAPCDVLEELAINGPPPAVLHLQDPYTFAAAEALAGRLLNAEPVAVDAEEIESGD